MKIDRVKLSRKYNLGNYETLDVGLEAELIDDDNALDTLRILEGTAENYLITRLAKVEKPKEEEKPKPQITVPTVIDVTGLQWELVQTDNPFEICKQQDAGSFKMLKAKIDEKQGKPIYVDGYLYWIMRDGITLARRQK